MFVCVFVPFVGCRHCVFLDLHMFQVTVTGREKSNYVSWNQLGCYGFTMVYHWKLKNTPLDSLTHQHISTSTHKQDSDKQLDPADLDSLEYWNIGAASNGLQFVSYPLAGWSYIHCRSGQLKTLHCKPNCNHNHLSSCAERHPCRKSCWTPQGTWELEQRPSGEIGVLTPELLESKPRALGQFAWGPLAHGLVGECWWSVINVTLKSIRVWSISTTIQVLSYSVSLHLNL